MTGKSDRIKHSILKALQDTEGPCGAARIMEKVSAMGINLQPRTIRFYLLQLDRDGLTRFVSRRLGRELTARGIEELAHANVIEKVGFIASRVDSLGYQMSFGIRTGKGSIITNLTLIDRRVLSMAMREMKMVFNCGLGMGTKLTIAFEGQKLAGYVVEENQAVIGTVCSVTVNGILLGEGIPVTSRFGGLLEMRNGTPVRFVELIEYAGTTLDPLEAFIQAGMTRVRDCARTGNGLIGASFREIPSVALEDAERIRKNMEHHGLSGILAFGKPNRPLLDIPVAEGRTGMIVIGGLNPVAALHEAGVRLRIHSLAGLEDYANFKNFEDLHREHA